MPDGFILSGDFSQYQLVKLRVDGSFDPSFGTGGFATLLRPPERLGTASGGSFYTSRGMAVARITAKGELDPDFTAKPDESEVAVALFTQRSGRIVVLGAFTARRYWP